MRDPVERVVQRIEEQLAVVAGAGVKPLELSAQHVTLHSVVGSTLRHTDVECLNLKAEESVFTNAVLAAAQQPEILSVTLSNRDNVRSLLKNTILNKRIRRIASLNKAVTASVPFIDLTTPRNDALHTKDAALSDILDSHHTWCRSCTAHTVESAFLRAMTTPMRLVDLRKARQALEENAAEPTPALVADCYTATERMKSSTVLPGLVARAREVAREIDAATSLVQQTSYFVLEELERRAVYEHLSSTSDTFLSLANTTSTQSTAVSLPLQTLATLWGAFCRAGVEGRNPRVSFSETAGSFSVKRYADAEALEPLVSSWEATVAEKIRQSGTRRFVVSRRDGHVYTSSSVVSSFVAITSGRADVVVTAVGPCIAALLQAEDIATVLGETPVDSATEIAAMTQSLIQAGGVLKEPLEAFQAATALSTSSL